MKILFTEVEPWQQSLIINAFPNDTVVCVQKPLSTDLLRKHHDTEILSIFIDSVITKEVLNQLPQLKLIVTRSTGYDHIDIQEARKKNITVCFDPTYATNAVAEYTFALLLNLVRLLYITCYQVKEQHCFTRANLCGIELKNKSIGIIGMGNIGKRVAHIARSFDMHILAYDIIENIDLARTLPCTFMPLKELLQQSDIISLHLPLTQKTYHLMNKETITYIKKGAYFINTARGELLDTNAFLAALQSGQIAGCALDVLENPHSKESQALIKHSCALITPHNAYNTTEAAHKLIKSTVSLIKTFIEDNTVSKNIVL